MIDNIPRPVRLTVATVAIVAAVAFTAACGSSGTRSATTTPTAVGAGAPVATNAPVNNAPVVVKPQPKDTRPAECRILTPAQFAALLDNQPVVKYSVDSSAGTCDFLGTTAFGSVTVLSGHAAAIDYGQTAPTAMRLMAFPLPSNGQPALDVNGQHGRGLAWNSSGSCLVDLSMGYPNPSVLTRGLIQATKAATTC